MKFAGYKLRDARIFTVASIPPVAVIQQAQAPVSGYNRRANFTFIGQSNNSLACTFQCQLSVTNLPSSANSVAVYSRSEGAITLGSWQKCTSPEVLSPSCIIRCVAAHQSESAFPLHISMRGLQEPPCLVRLPREHLQQVWQEWTHE